MGCNKKRDDILGATDCVCDVVNFIADLQDAVEDDLDCPTNCLRPVLGAFENKHKANTRPFILYTEDGKPFEAFFKPETDECPCGEEHHGKKLDFYCKSIFFRVESVDGCCAVLRVLEPDCLHSNCPQIADTDNLRRTCSCITVDLRCFCAIQCLDDTFIPGV
ncbi:CotY/CotZ family spore coat protein [Bacillus salitolerans]|uniref:CotY/CotZ family spore coat protein n=1 Tax=Bacillus salitolerans TaxID=1437434 RepID=A0ABW4LK83_9BACI